MDFEDLKKLYQNRKIDIGTAKKPQWVSIADVWLNHAERKTYYGGVVYAPPGIAAPADTLNLCRAFSVRPVRNSSSMAPV